MTSALALIDPGELRRLTLPADQASTRPFLDAMAGAALGTPSPLVGNIATTIRLLQIGPHVIPVTVNDTDYNNSWVCSPYNSAVTYPLDELRHVPSPALRTALAGLISSVAPLLRACRINRVVCINNWLLSTNLYPDIDIRQVQPLTAMMRDLFPGHAILFRSLNAVTNGPLMAALRASGYLLAPSRQVYLYDGRRPDYLDRPNCRRDRELLERRDHVTVVPHDRISDFSRVRELYDLLYLHKYSWHNPQYTETLMRIWHESHMLTLFGLANDSAGLEAVVGAFAMNGVLTAPLVGYDTAQPQSRGLYRMLMALVLQQAANERLLLNLSAGAASFKRLRGGQGELEYSAVYCRHLPMRQRAAWTALVTLLEQVGARVLRRYEL